MTDAPVWVETVNHHDQGKARPFEIGLIRKSRENKAKPVGRMPATFACLAIDPPSFAFGRIDLDDCSPKFLRRSRVYKSAQRFYPRFYPP